MDDRRNDRSGEAADDPRRAGRPRPGGGEGVRIIGAEEAAAALEAGQAAGRGRAAPGPRYGDVPPPPGGPRPSLSFPLPEDDDPAGILPSPSAEVVPPTPPSDRPGRGPRRLYEPPLPSSGDDVDDPFWPSEPSEGSPVAPDQGPPPGRRRAEGSRFDPAPAPGRRAAPRSTAPPDAGGTGSTSSFDEPPGPLEGAGPPTGPTVLPHWSEPPTGEVPRILPGEEPPPPEDDLGAWTTLAGGPRWRDQATDWDEADFSDPSLLGDEGTRVGALAPDPDEPEGSILLGERAAFPTEAMPPPIAVHRQSARDLGGPPLYDEPQGAGGGSGRDMGTAVLTGAIIGVVVLLAAKIGPAALLVVCGVFVVMAAAELFGALHQRGYHPATLLGLVATACLLGAAYWRGEAALPLVMALFVLFTMLWYLLGVVKVQPAVNIAITLLAFTYVSFLGSFAALMLTLPNRHGIAFFLGAVVATVANDVGALFVGTRMGRTPMAGAISPNKTWEGFMGASTATLVVCLLVVRGIEPWNAGRAFALALVVIVAAPLGDLCESMIKRDLRIKDIGWILPGHGGILDRIDGLLFVIPATYYLVRLLGIA